MVAPGRLSDNPFAVVGPIRGIVVQRLPVGSPRGVAAPLMWDPGSHSPDQCTCESPDSCKRILPELAADAFR